MNTPDILNTREWLDFENQFEEDFEDNPEVFHLINEDHHLEVAALAATALSKRYKSIDEIIDNHSIMQEAYNQAAKLLYPNEKLWQGTEYNSIEYQKEEQKYNTLSYLEGLLETFREDQQKKIETIKQTLLETLTGERGPNG